MRSFPIYRLPPAFMIGRMGIAVDRDFSIVDRVFELNVAADVSAGNHGSIKLTYGFIANDTIITIHIAVNHTCFFNSSIRFFK